MPSVALLRPRSILVGAVTAAVAVGASLMSTVPADAAAAVCSSMTRGVYDRVDIPQRRQALVVTKATAAKLTAAGYSDNRGRPFSVAVSSTKSKAGLTPVHSLYDPATKDRAYVTGSGAIANLVAKGRRDDGVRFWVSTKAASCLVPVYELTKDGRHRYETLKADRLALREAGWSEKGVVFYGGKAPRDSVFSIAVIPDTQTEAVRAGDPRLKQRMQWLIDNRRKLDLRYVTHSGDFVNWDTSSHDQYVRARSAATMLRKAGIPFSLSIGNHDTAAVCPGGSACVGKSARVTVRDTTSFNTYLNSGTANLAGRYESDKIDNTYSTFTAGNRKWLVLNLELWPRTGVINWARTVVADHEDHNVIVVTHAYLTSRGKISTSNGGYGANTPEVLYDRLISQYPNIKMVFSGHVGKSAHRVDRGVNGNRIDSFLLCMHDNITNPVRLVTINTAKGTVSSRVYAPYTDKDYPAYTVRAAKTTWVK